MKNSISYPKLILTAFILFFIGISSVPLHAEINWIYSNQEVKDYLIENDPAINASNVSEEMLEIIKHNHTGAMADLQFVILRDSQLDILSVFSSTEPPDYGTAGKIVKDIGLPVINELASWAGYFNPFFSGVISAVTTFGDIANYASWLYFNQDLIFVNKQIQYYFYYKTDSSDPFADYGIIGPGYLYPPGGMNYGGVYEPLHPEIYTVDRVKQLAEAWYLYKQQHDSDYNQYRAEILSGVNSILQPILEAYDKYATGALCKALVVGEQLVVVCNKGNFPMQNVVLVNDRIIGDQRTDPIDIDPGKNASIQTDFTDIDYIEFEIFGASVQLDFSAVTVSIIPLFTYEFADDPAYAPQLVTFRINPIPIGEPYSYHLDFGDGNSTDGSSTVAVFESHTYSAPGRFNVSLTVTGSDIYSDTSSRIVTIENPVVAAYPLCSDDQGFAPFSIAFDASGSSCATGGVLSYYWDFGDGHEGSGINPNHTFDAGSFQVELTVSLNPEIFASSVQSVKVYNTANALSVTPSFQNVPSPGGTTTFGIANTGDGTMNWTAQVDPSDTWLTIVNESLGTDDGIITIDYGANSGDARTGSITVTADNAENSPQTIEVRQAAYGFTVDFEASPCFGNSPLTVQLTDLSASENPITSWQWFLGDGGTSAEQNPVHSYQTPGTYHVTLAVTDGTSSSSTTKSSYIRVSSRPSAPDINIVAIEYFFDADPGPGNGISIPIVPANLVTVQTIIDLSNLSTGLHRLYVRARDENGNWGIVQSKLVLVQKAGVGGHTLLPLPKIMDIEYFFDDDPDYGSGLNLNFTWDNDVDLSTNIDLSNLSTGLHRLYVRARDENGNWGIVQSKLVLIQKTGSDTPLPNITGVEYFFDQDPGFGNGANLAFRPDVTVEIGTNLPLYSLALGDHSLYVRAQDENGLWGIAQFSEFSVEGVPVDSDGDGLTDELENTTCTDPFDADTDNDGISDGAEDVNKNGVVDSDETDPCNNDTDSDGMPDGWEVANQLNPLANDAFADKDGDGFCNWREYLAGTNPDDPEDIPDNIDIYVDDDNTSGIEDGSVPNPFNSIQEGVDFSGPGDTVSVSAGNYTENVAIERNIFLVGEGAKVTIIDGSGAEDATIRCVSTTSGKIKGFHIHNGTGAGIRCEDAVLSIERNVISGTSNGDGIKVGAGSSVNIENNVIYENNLDGIAFEGLAVTIINNTIVSNSGDGISCSSGDGVMIKNNIIVSNGNYGISCNPSSNPEILYNNLWNNGTDNYSGCGAGTGDMSDNPRFKDSVACDFHITSGSPCIDAGTGDGTPEFDFDGNGRYDDPDTEPNTGGGTDTDYDMGAYEYFPVCKGDLDKDLDVDGSDLVIFSDAIGSSSGGPGYNPVADFDGDGFVDETDLATFAEEFGRTDCPICP